MESPFQALEKYYNFPTRLDIPNRPGTSNLNGRPLKATSNSNSFVAMVPVGASRSQPLGGRTHVNSTEDREDDRENSPACLLQRKVKIRDMDDAGNVDNEEQEDFGTVLEQNLPAKSRKPSERKRADQAAFDSWREENRNEIRKTTPKKGPSSNEDKSIAWLFRESATDKIIESPRDYQVELFERAKQRNIIAVLDTGTYS
jgi:hypothetical protein